ncbi:MAG: ArnT family glycosyltransferase, partial [Pseudohongiellaceae bacterium]
MSRKNKKRKARPDLTRAKAKPAATFLAWAEAFEQKTAIHPAGLWLLFALVLLLPQFFGPKVGGIDPKQLPLLDNIGHATVFFTDEPHYMTLISSIINDGDLDVKNNYASTHSGGIDSGIRFKRDPMWHHSYFYLPEGYHWWQELVEGNANGYPSFFANAEQGGISFRYKPEYAHLADLPEYSWHPPYMAILGYPFLRMFKDSPLLEPAAIFLSYLVTLLAAAFTYWCFGRITQSVLVRFTAVALIFLASPIWHYTRTLLTEPYIAAFLMCAYACFWRGESLYIKYLAAGVFIGLGMLMKNFVVLAMLPMFYLVLRSKQWQPFVALCVGPFLGGCAVLFWYYLQTGSPFITPTGSATDPNAPGDYYLTLSVFLPTAYNMMFSLQYGLLPFCPALIPAAYGWWQLLKRHGKQVGVALLMALPYFLFFTIYTGTPDGLNYGPRYMAAILPLLLVGIIGFLAYAKLPRTSTMAMWGLLA